MIIGEHNLIIGSICTIVNEKSSSVFFYIIKQQNYILPFFKHIFLYIIPKTTSPPYNFLK